MAKIPDSEKHFSDYLIENNDILIENDLTLDKFIVAFKSLKSNKSSGIDDINPNIIISSYNQIVIPLFHICKMSLKQGLFPANLKIAKVIPLFKSEESEFVDNYRPISILPAFSKILE